MTPTTLDPPPQVSPPTHLGRSPENSTQTEFEANRETVEPLIAALHKRLRLVARSRDPHGFDRQALLNLDTEAWGIADQ